MLKKIILTFFVAIMLLVPFSSAFAAATVGQELKTPEAGWKRFDNYDGKILFPGGTVWTHKDLFNGSHTYAESPFENKYIIFKFYGTKLRIIDVMADNRVLDGMTITIDGVSEVYSTYSSTTSWQRLVYEKTGLSLGEHIVTIKPNIDKYTKDKYFSIDAVDIDDTGYLIDEKSPKNLVATGGDKQVVLSWNSELTEARYNIKRATTPGGPYTTVEKNVYGTTFTDNDVQNGKTYYYVVSSVFNGTESSNSIEAFATPLEPPVNGRAILVVTLDTGLEKEFDLSMAEVNAFIAWYEGKAAGTGPASYAIDKHDNNKGPFKSRKDYVIFDKILTYEVNEYTLVSK
ncbi:fibronectin type III domain-containing protein [Paenibacillus elgii]